MHVKEIFITKPYLPPMEEYITVIKKNLAEPYFNEYGAYT